MSEKEEENIDTMIEKLLKEYAGQNEALEKILEKILPDNELQGDNDNENNLKTK